MTNTIKTTTDNPTSYPVALIDCPTILPEQPTQTIYATPEQISFSKAVLDFGKSLNLMLVLSIIGCLSITILFYDASFELKVLAKHQIVLMGLLAIIQSSVMANTFIVKQTLVKGNITSVLQITTGPDVDEESRRGHLLFISSLYQGSMTVTAFLAIAFLLLGAYVNYTTKMPFDTILLILAAVFIAVSLVNSVVISAKNRVVKALLLG